MKVYILKLSIVLIIFTIPVFLSACRIKKDGSDHNAKKEFIGEYRSIKGVKDNLSCYCYNAGYLTLDDGSVIGLCFKNNEEAINCTRIKVHGEYEIYNSPSEETSPCPSGDKKILTVSKLECLD